MAKFINPEFKDKLVAALRSGKYKQTSGLMHKNGCFCMEGVIADLYAKENGLRWEESPEKGKKFIPGFCGVYWMYQDAWGVITQNGDSSFLVSGVEETIMRMNDKGMTFLEIADIIEAQG